MGIRALKNPFGGLVERAGIWPTKGNINIAAENVVGSM